MFNTVGKSLKESLFLVSAGDVVGRRAEVLRKLSGCRNQREVRVS